MIHFKAVNRHKFLAPGKARLFQPLVILVILLTSIGFLHGQPARNLFRTTVLLGNLSSPTQFAFLPDGRIYILSKNGVIRLFDPQAPAGTATITAATLTVSNVREDGLHSIVLDPAFLTNRNVFLLFGSLTPTPALIVARYTALPSGVLDLNTRKDILSVPYSITASDEHNTGCLAFDPQGNLYIGLADNTNGFFSGPTSGFSPRDPARPNLDAQRSAANSFDLRGKILRIHPESNGTYTIPSGNLFSAGTPRTRPEIYAMGLRHPFRITVDEKTGWLFWAEPGPNATADDPNQGPRGYDEVNMAKTAGNYGYPYCTANNFCYKEYNYQTSTGGATYNPDALQNKSSNNTGILDLPPARPALVWYPYRSIGTAFPVFENGGTNAAMLGPVYNFNPAIVSVNKIPAYYDKHLFIFDFSRSLIHAVQMDATGGVVAVKRFWDQTTANPINNPIDLKIGPDGAFYFLSWGDNGYPSNGGRGNLVRLDYTGPVDAIGHKRPSILTKREPTTTWRALGLVRKVTLPAGAISAVAYDLVGSRVWNWKLSADADFSPKVIGLPSTLSGLLRIRIDCQ